MWELWWGDFPQMARDVLTLGKKKERQRMHLECSSFMLKQKAKVFRLYRKNLTKAQNHKPQSCSILVCFPSTYTQMYICTSKHIYIYVYMDATEQLQESFLKPPQPFSFKRGSSTGKASLSRPGWLASKALGSIHL